MTKNTLKGYKQLKTRLKSIDDRICRQGFLPELINAREDILHQIRAIEQFIAECEDPVAYTIMRHKYLEGLTWEETAERVGGNTTGDNCRMIVNRILN